jgi:hypothetical protein
MTFGDGEGKMSDISIHQYREVVIQQNWTTNDPIKDFKIYINQKTVEIDPKDRENKDIPEYK